MPEELVITIDLDKFDPEDLQLGDIEEFEDYTGSTLEELTGLVRAGNLSSKMLTGLAWLCARSTHPEFTLDQARALKLRQIDTSKAPGLSVARARTTGNRSTRRSTKSNGKRG